MFEMKTSVIIPAYNASAFVIDTLDSIVAQTAPVFEILVIDDGSSDNTTDLVRGWFEARPHVRGMLISQENARQGAARNNGVLHATGDWLAFLDADDTWLPEKNRVFSDAVQRNPDADVLYCNATVFSQQGVENQQAIPVDFANRPIRYFRKLTNHIYTSSSMVRRSVFFQLGGFDESADCFGVEDYDLWIRAAEAGKRFLTIGEPSLRYRRHGAQTTASHMSQARRALFVHQRHFGFSPAARLERSLFCIRSCFVAKALLPPEIILQLLTLGGKDLFSLPRRLPARRSRIRATTSCPAG